MIKQECIGIPDMILLIMNFFVSKKIKIKAEIVLSPGGAYFLNFCIRNFFEKHYCKLDEFLRNFCFGCFPFRVFLAL